MRPEAAEAVALLGRLGCTAAMLTGDAAAAAAAVGAAAGIPPKQIHARLLPEDKLAKVGRLLWTPIALGIVANEHARLS